VTPGTYEKQNEYYLKWGGVKGEEGSAWGYRIYSLKKRRDSEIFEKTQNSLL